ncbi:pyrroloquinoline quinone biosynthesis protein PqqE [Neoasaia chiangmaiensis NBRC 101099]|uniref:PqqA peptide cyclase n=1 Tax=Neoasaia chiangmaiensis TaxID=320497 RepID=A0A1U9KQF7_9PROT|nr:pyrroloquinoline quinone biosynthesis protein PqqE [Neoasaia chiangmaiensis]AQS88033.1 pyrroloquinoline quinone biosynthesis protein PqqE [Neoasaia chiangmaiensis]GBR38811.1 pyrroloquinoline quinone biosynthesis protein PqqE [Neoasaia chiangmaiensis NBRC 101099]GEN15706.1 coenzyme PQQ synthesis protein E [Neoasaia chiangmaiensis]
MTNAPPPMSLLAELTHRCPLACPYCSNPVDLERRNAELDTATWRRVLDEAAALGVLQVHFSGGEPMARPDLPELVAHARKLDLYTNLITSGVMLDAARLRVLSDAGLDHVQLSFQDVETQGAEAIGGLRGAQAKKLEAVRLLQAEGMPLTLNFVVHRHNVARIRAMIDWAHDFGAGRVEIAHTQYYGWGLRNRDALMPSRTQLEEATRTVDAARAHYGHALAIDYVTPDYHADQPKPCMGGWGQRFVNISPSGRVLPCHAAETIPDVAFPNVRDQSLATIWNDAPLFNLFRGTDWMPAPCRTCDQREVDWGGCRCQALALTGNAAATDPVCARSPHHQRVLDAVDRHEDATWVYRRYETATSPS